MATAKSGAKKTATTEKKPAAAKPAATKVAADKPAAKAAAAKSPPPAPAKPAAADAKPVSAFNRPLTPSAALAAVIGADPVPRTEVVSRVWAYIREHNLQDPANRRMINGDAKLRKVLGKAQVSMFELSKCLSNHLTK